MDKKENELIFTQIKWVSKEESKTIYGLPEFMDKIHDNIIKQQEVHETEESESEVYMVNKCLPENGEKVLCYGYHTYCCKSDMDDEPNWHEVTFKINFSSYKLKKEIPKDPEETIFEYYNVLEEWSCGPEFTDGHVIGVTKWKNIKLNENVK